MRKTPDIPDIGEWFSLAHVYGVREVKMGSFAEKRLRQYCASVSKDFAEKIFADGRLYGVKFVVEDK